MKSKLNVGNALYDISRSIKAIGPTLGQYTVGDVSEKSRGITGAAAISNPQVNTLAFFYCAIDKGQLRLGLDPLEHNTFLVEKTGSTEGTAFKCMVERKNGVITVTSNKEDEKIPAIVVGLLTLMPDVRNRENYGVFAQKLKEDLQNNRLDMTFDMFYCFLKSIKVLNEEINIDVNKEAVENAMARHLSFEPVKVPEELSPLLSEEFFPTLEQAETKSTPAQSQGNTLDEFIQACRSRKYRLFDIYFGDTDRIPSLSVLDSYAPSEEFKSNVLRMYRVMCEACGLRPDGTADPMLTEKRYAVEMDSVMNAMYFGPPGTGKSHMCTAIGAALGVPVYQFTVTGGFEEGNFDKMPVFKDNGIQMVSQPFRDGFENGGIIVVDEVNLGKSDILMYLSGALERPYLLGQGSNDQIKRNAKTIIVGTCNPGVNGTKRQNVAFLNRFSFWTEFKAADRERLFRELSAKKKGLELSKPGNKKYVDRMLTVYEMIIEGLKKKMQEAEAYTQVLSLRNLSGCCDNFFVYGLSLEKSIRDSILSPVTYLISENADQDTVDEFKDNVLQAIEIQLKNDEFKKTYEGAKP